MNENLTIAVHFANIAEELKWETNFCDFLKIILKQITGNNPVIISNLDIEGTVFNSMAENVDDMQADAIIIVFNHYYENISDDELKVIHSLIDRFEKNQQNLIYIAQRLNKQSQRLPKELQHYPVYNFFEINPKTLELIDFKQEHHGEEDNLYLLKLTDLAYDIKVNLTSEETDDPDKLRIKTIYLAEVSNDQIKNHDTLKRSLLLSGYKVLPGNSLIAEENYEKAVKENLEKCILSINILGELYGDTYQSSDYSYQELQNRYFHDVWTAQQKNNTYFPVIRRIIWMPPQLEPFEEKQAQYIKRINREINNSENTELIQSTLSDLKIIIDQKIKLISQPEINKINFRSDELLLVFDYNNQELSEKIVETLARLKVNYRFLSEFTNIHFYNQLDLMNFINKFSNYLLFNTKNDSLWISGIINLIARSKGYEGNVTEGRIGLFTVNAKTGFNNSTTLYVEPIVYDRENLTDKLEAYISQLANLN